MILSEKEEQLIRKNLSGANELIEGSVDTLLLSLDDLITADGFDEDYELNDFGRQMQNLYDGIYNKNM